VRSEEGERPTVGRRRILGTVRLRRSASTPQVFISFPRHGARHRILAVDQTTCLVRFSVYIAWRSSRCRNFVRPVTSPFLGSRHVQPSGQILPTLRTATHTHPSEFICLPLKGIHATRSMSPCRDYSPCPYPILEYALALNDSGSIDTEHSLASVSTLSTNTRTLELLCSSCPFVV
jgi:hypothetical protein